MTKMIARSTFSRKAVGRRAGCSFNRKGMGRRACGPEELPR
jgi:hypothetical protein